MIEEEKDEAVLTPEQIEYAFAYAKEKHEPNPRYVKIQALTMATIEAQSRRDAIRKEARERGVPFEDLEPPAEKIKVAVAQFAASNVVINNIDEIVRLTYAASATEADILVFPEASMIRFHATLEHLKRTARDVEAAFRKGLAELAKDANLAIVCGIMQPSPNPDDERVLNSLLVINKEGDERHCYQKIHLYDAFDFKESERVQPGDPKQLPIFRIGGFTMGLLNCYDLRFPEAARRLALAGADALIVSAAWVQGSDKEAHWDILCKARAIENTCFVIASAQTPKRCCGHSMILDPMGNVLAGATSEPGIIVHTLQRARLRTVREQMPCLTHVRL